MKRIFLYIMTALVLAACGRRESSFSGTGGGGDSLCVTPDILLPVTPVKNQGNTELCWIYAMLAAIETDRLAQGDSVNLSPLWVARKALEEAAVETLLARRKVTLRGTLPEAMRLIQTHGVVAWDAYNNSAQGSSRAAARKVENMARMGYMHNKGIEALRRDVGDVLDNTLGPAPHNVFMFGMEYTPLEFAHSLCLPADWRAFTSFTHHPFRRSYAVEVPDNRQRHEAMNVPLGELLAMTVGSLRGGHPVAWEGSMAFLGKGRGGGKELPEACGGQENVAPADMERLQGLRQKMLESHRLTDDHCMTVIGMGHDKKGQRYFILKNSWGVNRGHDGMVYMTEQQFALSTIMIMARQ